MLQHVTQTLCALFNCRIYCWLFVCSDLDRQLSLGVDTEFCVITSSIPPSPRPPRIRAPLIRGQAGKKMSIIHPVSLLTCHICLRGGCIDNESVTLTISAGVMCCAVCPEGRRRIIDMSDAIMRFAIKSLISKRNCYFFLFFF